MTPKFILPALLAVTVGCTTVRETQTERTATEQLMLSHAVMAAAKAIEAEPLRGKKVFLETGFVKSLDQEFVIGELRARMLQIGADLVQDANASEVVVEARSAGLGIDEATSNLGIPAVPIPVPMVGTFQTPEISFFKAQQRTGISGLSLTAYEQATGKHLFSVGPVIGSTHRNDWSIIGIRIYRNRNNLPPEVK